MTFDLSTIGALVAITVPIVGGMAWLFKLDGRITVQEARLEDIIDRLVRIEHKIDGLNGHMR